MNKVTISLLFTVAAMLAASPACADGMKLDIYGGSYHVQQENMNEVNTGLGLQVKAYENGIFSSYYAFGAFKDSYRNISGYVGLKNDIEIYNGVSLGADVFVMSRRTVKDGRPFIGALPRVSIGYVNIGYVPNFGQFKETWLFSLTIPL